MLISIFDVDGDEMRLYGSEVQCQGLCLRHVCLRLGHVSPERGCFVYFPTRGGHSGLE